MIGQNKSLNGIGTLAEKTVHAVLKNYISPDMNNHEIKIAGYVADIYTGQEIIEVQTRNFNTLRRKLRAFLKLAPVTIVYPIPNTKWIRWINPQTGEISPPRKSPKRGQPYAIFPELYKIKDFLLDPNIRLRIELIDLEEYRYLDGWSKDLKKGSSRCDQIPMQLAKEFFISSVSDYQQLIPDTLTDEFTAKDYRKASGLSLSAAQTSLNILYYVGAVDRIGKKGRAFLYCKTK